MKVFMRRIGAVAVVAGFLVMLTAPTAWAGEKRHGFGIVMSRDVLKSNLGIEETVYVVSSSTVFKDLDGQVVAFAALPVFDVHQGLFDLNDATKVEYWAEQRRDGAWVLKNVEMFDALPN